MKIKNIIHYVLALLTFVGLVFFVVENTPNPVLKFEIYQDYFGYIFDGFLWTIFISISVFVLSFIVGGVMFFASKSKIPYIRYLAKLWTSFMFGSPLIVIVVIFYFFIGTAFGISDRLFLGILSLTLYFAPFMMKLYQSAYSSIDKKQYLVCNIFGFNKFQMYYYIIFPQMIRIMIPPLTGNLANVIKSSSLLYLIGFKELYYTITNVQSKSFAFTEGYIIMPILYLVITIPLLKLSSMLEKRIKL